MGCPEQACALPQIVYMLRVYGVPTSEFEMNSTPYMYLYTCTYYTCTCTSLLHVYPGVRVQAGLVVARLWSCSSEEMAADDVNQYLGWTIAQLSRSVGTYVVHEQT